MCECTNPNPVKSDHADIPQTADIDAAKAATLTWPGCIKFQFDSNAEGDLTELDLCKCIGKKYACAVTHILYFDRSKYKPPAKLPKQLSKHDKIPEFQALCSDPQTAALIQGTL